jgi:hypothetical protein
MDHDEAIAIMDRLPKNRLDSFDVAFINLLRSAIEQNPGFEIPRYHEEWLLHLKEKFPCDD